MNKQPSRLDEALGRGLNVTVSVDRAIPRFNALPGDEIVLQLQDPDFPIVVRRTFPAELLNAIPRDAITVLGAYEPGAVVPVIEGDGGEPPHLSLVKGGSQ